MKRPVATDPDRSRQIDPLRHPCDRCRAAEAAARWIAGDRPALKCIPEFRLCPSCLDAFRLFLSHVG